VDLYDSSADSSELGVRSTPEIALPNKVYSKLEEVASEEGLTVSEFASKLIVENYPVKRA
jgi:hypothetical protein